MMLKNEIRIGNIVLREKWLQRSYGQPDREYDQIIISHCDFTAITLKPEKFKPIPITPEIMVNNFGFEQKGDEFVMTGWCGYRHWLIYLDGCFYLTNSQSDGFHYVYAYRYVHQIQNLFFALTGFEAKLIKPL